MVIDLLIALIKDLRHDIYEEFVTQIMPAVVQVLDVQNLVLIDKVFTLFSFCMKFLSKNIKEDFSNFYNVFQEMVIHKNRHLRKFSAQSLCYVLRKLEISKETLTTLMRPIYQRDEEVGPY